ncbi:DUF5134 domain-containing protein [Kitasatospora camelliae]|uniref:DUF5134 domain-containing protein n=1 Tax=Kitasatospora camelliae TaxID=3156397 RepID=A0AAU8JRC7_9ACTN
MHGPAVVTWLLAALATGSALLCLHRLRSRARTCGEDREVDAAEAAMGIGMAGMALLPGVAWGWLFAVLAGVLLLGAVGPGTAGPRGHRLHHGVGALAMAYMALAMAGGGGPRTGGADQAAGVAASAASAATAASAGPAGVAAVPAHLHHAAPAGLPLLTGLLLAYFGGYALWAGSRLLAGPGGHGAAGVPSFPAVRVPAAEQLGQACRAAMGIGMFAMLLTM